ncbi:diacylglycerol kinase family protein [Leadbetterella byssophila]|uniref:Diacylglycerol kinase n=1 Tax=Leadbetterella byssophila (strain DSM 17132 / JCM 16389 / KACC 11308 / NBRC 106382 / 4M15) TaxID=649349 RepID=E4RU03_LEAB4|nr:diacylglycerol kinase family protein [Leadbetterella byssophila]ADQ18711.1 diacylglycerol kinase [Leadbetterella byssophila DSM 17132]
MDFKRMFRSFRFAGKGLYQLALQENNAKFHLLATVLVLMGGGYFHLNTVEWCLVTFAIVLVWAAEAINTALEVLCDRISTQKDPMIGKVKDLAAGGVLVCAMGAFAVGVFIFGPRILAFFQG